MKIYTKTGDRGETGLIGGARISKSSQRIIAYGLVDELNSSIGFSISLLKENSKDVFADIIVILTRIQNDLFIIGADLADPSYDRYKNSTQVHNKVPRAEADMTILLESAIDRFEAILTPITYFLLPGGSLGSSSLHMNRTAARRSEIAVVTLSQKESINPLILTYLNRLSDLLFVIARVVNQRVGVSDIKWESVKE
ncbi:MAG TPA: cob(I)yrinic acid a,c-diamide adenosyltransferase [Nitrososphaeraceae archaeon]|jgi:cob(I)alamin adenosyltransferase